VVKIPLNVGCYNVITCGYSSTKATDELTCGMFYSAGPKAGMALVGHADANRHALLNTRKLPVYSTFRLCQQTQTLNILVVVQGQCTMGCAADERGMEGGFSAP
jgi:hypothetical protein